MVVWLGGCWEVSRSRRDGEELCLLRGAVRGLCGNVLVRCCDEAGRYWRYIYVFKLALKRRNELVQTSFLNKVSGWK